MTVHSGYTIKNPTNFVHNHRDAVNRLGTIATYILRGAAIAGRAHGNMGFPGGLFDSTAASTQQMSGNRVQMNRVGLDPADFNSRQLAVDNHQREAMRILLRAAAVQDRAGSMTGGLNDIVLEGGRTIWVCEECRNRLQSNQHITPEHHTSLEEYLSLTRREKIIDGVLRSYASVMFLADVISNSPATQKVTIRIVPGYFEDPGRRDGTRFNAIMDKFNDLGHALQDRKCLTSLEIQGNSLTDRPYVGLQAVLKCSSLQRLAIQGLPLFLQGSRLPNESRYLTQLVLDGVLINNEDAANNLAKTIGANTVLKSLRLSRAGFTATALSALFSSKHDKMQKRFGRLTQLDLSNNMLDTVTAVRFLNMAVSGKSLESLELSGNPWLGDAGYNQIWELLRASGRSVDLKI